MNTPTSQSRPFDDAHPSWYPRVLEVLARDHPDISEEVWATAISENATRQNAARRAKAANDQPDQPEQPGEIFGAIYDYWIDDRR